MDTKGEKGDTSGTATLADPENPYAIEPEGELPALLPAPVHVPKVKTVSNGAKPNWPSTQNIKQTKPFKWWHERILNDIMCFPNSKLADRAGRLNYAPAYLSVIIGSDMFQAKLAQRQKEYRERLDASVMQKTVEVADKALDIVKKQLDKKGDNIPFRDLSDFTHKTLGALGYGAPAGNNGVNIDNRTVVIGESVTPEQLEKARARLRDVEQHRATEIEDAVTEPGVVDASRLSTSGD